MYIINFLVALVIPWIGLLGFFGPTYYLVPDYFANETISLIASIFGAICGFWFGFLRNFVGYSGRLSEIFYQKLLWGTLLLLVITKIIYALPHMWYSSTVGFILGFFSISRELSVGKYQILIMAILSMILLIYLGFILIGCAWFNYDMSKFFYFIFLGTEYLKDYIEKMYLLV